MTHRYRVFGQVLSSSIPLSGLQHDDADRKEDIRFSTCQPSDVDTEGFEVFQQWRSRSGRVAIEGRRSQKGFVLVFPGQAEFFISSDLVSIFLVGQEILDPFVLRHLLIDQVLPRVLNQRGMPVVHASAVTLRGGATIALLGASGSGKSTLAASWSLAGAQTVADDALAFVLSNGAVTVASAHSDLRLWPATAGTLGLSKQSAEWCGSKCLIHGTRESRGDRTVRRLDAIFILGGEPENTDVTDIRIDPATSARDAVSVIESIFALDISDRRVLGRNLAFASSLTSGLLPAFRLYFPRRFDALPRVRSHVETILAGYRDKANLDPVNSMDAR